MVTGRHHLVFKGLWPVNLANLCFIIVKSTHFSCNFFDSRVSELLIVVSLGRYPNFVPGKWLDFSPNGHFVKIFTQSVKIGDFVSDLTIFDNITIDFKVKMR